MQNLFASSVCHTVLAYVGGSKKLWLLEPHSLRIEIVPGPSWNAPFSARYHTRISWVCVKPQFCTPLRKPMGVPEKNWGRYHGPPFWHGASLTPWNTHLHGLALPYLADDCILASPWQVSPPSAFGRRGHMHRPEDPLPVLVTGVSPLPAPGSGTAYRRICDGQTWRIPSITEDISVCLGTAETAAH